MVGPTCRRLVELTATRDRSVDELVDGTELSQPAVSKQLGTLKEGGLVSVRRAENGCTRHEPKN